VVVPDSWEDAAVGTEAEGVDLVLDAPVVKEGTAATISNLFVHPQAPLPPRPTPSPPLPMQSEAQPASVVRRSTRLINKPKMHALDTAVQVLNTKMGVADVGIPLLAARKA
jgi:hypothetical protein